MEINLNMLTYLHSFHLYFATQSVLILLFVPFSLRLYSKENANANETSFTSSMSALSFIYSYVTYVASVLFAHHVNIFKLCKQSLASSSSTAYRLRSVHKSERTINYSDKMGPTVVVLFVLFEWFG